MIRIRNEHASDLVDWLDSIEESVTDSRVLKELKDNIIDQLKSPRHDTDLIDHIASMLGTSGNSLSHSALAVMRRALFSPRELAKLKANPKEMHCNSCHRRIETGEMGTVCEDVIYCSHCEGPDRLYCKTCKSLTSFPRQGLARILKKAEKECLACANKGREEETIKNLAHELKTFDLSDTNISRPDPVPPRPEEFRHVATGEFRPSVPQQVIADETRRIEWGQFRPSDMTEAVNIPIGEVTYGNSPPVDRDLWGIGNTVASTTSTLLSSDDDPF
jgi:hypothetical protein